MNVDEAQVLLNGCVRSELRDHAFGDTEVTWTNGNDLIAEGYFNGEKADVFLIDPHEGIFKGSDAFILLRCGTDGVLERNDSIGPEEFVIGRTMSKLTKEGVKEELTKGKE